MSTLRLVVIGAGPMGRLHTRAITRRAATSGDCDLVGVVDRNLSRSEAVAREFGGRALDSLEACAGDVDAAVVAVPTRSHSAVARRVLELGLDVLVEKPMSETVAEARDLVQLARDRDCILGVGHVEWFNVSLREALRRAGTPRRIEADRFSPQSDRGLDIDVVQDFMLHDLDWATRVVESEVIEVDAFGRTVSNSRLDEAEAELIFASGCRARLRASRVHSKRIRRVRIEGALETVELDLLEKQDVEPLDAQWADFLRACRSRKPPENDGTVGLAAMEIVERVRRKIAGAAEEVRHEDDPFLSR